MRAALLFIAYFMAPSAIAADSCEGFVTEGDAVEEIRRLEHAGAAVNTEGWTLDEAKAFLVPEWASVNPQGGTLTADMVFSIFQDGKLPATARRF